MGAGRRYLEKRNPEARQARFYVLHIAPTLFGEWSLVREWGRIGSPGQLKIEWFPTQEEAQGALERRVREKLRRGYHEP